MNPASFLVHAFVWSLILAGLIMGIGYVIEVWKQFVHDWKYAAELRRASQRRVTGSDADTPPSAASPVARSRPFDWESDDAA